MNEAFTTHSPPWWLADYWLRKCLIPQFECKHRWRSGSFNQQPKIMIAIKIRLIVLPYSTAATEWVKAEWRWTKLKVILLLSAFERIRCFISLRPHQHITGFGTKVTTEGQAWSIHHRGKRHPSLPPFKRVGLTLWFHSHSHWESVSGKASIKGVILWNSVIFALISK